MLRSAFPEDYYLLKVRLESLPEDQSQQLAYATGCERHRRQQEAAKNDHRSWLAARWQHTVARIGARRADATLDNFELHGDNKCRKRQTDVLSRLRDYETRMPGFVAEGVGLWLRGPVGTGKDHCLTALARLATFRHELSVKWSTGADIFVAFRDAMRRDESEAHLIESFTAAEILYISDPLPPSGDLTGYQSNILFAIADARNTHKRPTWITTNAADDADEGDRLGYATCDRLKQDAIILSCNWPSYRRPLGRLGDR
jgi:DNA replication protein DnaC